MPRKIRLRINFPDESLWQEVRRHRDRAAGIIGGAIVEEYLELAISSFWRSGDSAPEKDARGKLLGPGGVLTFSAKIELAFMTRLIGTVMRDDLRLLNKLRNMFAHQALMDNCHRVPQPVDFKHQILKENCKNFYLVDKINLIVDGRASRRKLARHRYLATVLIATIALRSYIHEPKSEKKKNIIDSVLHFESPSTARSATK